MTAHAPPRVTADVEALVDSILARVGKRVVMALPLGLGKPCRIVNALYRRAEKDPDLHLIIVTALSLGRPSPRNDLERRFMDPLMERIFGDYPALAYLEPLAKGTLPDNVEILEFFLTPGKSLDNALEQQHYISSNYTHVVRDVTALGVNVCAQMLAREVNNGRTNYSLGCNADLTHELINQMRERERQGQPVAVVGEINGNLPFMVNDALVPPAAFDLVLDNPSCTYTLPGPPNLAVSTVDHALGLLASTLIRDGGTLQIGIGSLGDAIACATRLRHEDNTAYRGLLADLELEAKFGDAVAAMGQTGVFEKGLYGASEMFTNGFWELYRSGVLKREVYMNETLQQLVNESRIRPEFDQQILDVLLEAGVIQPRLTRLDVAWLKRFGIFKASVVYDEDGLRVPPDLRIESDLTVAGNRDRIVRHCLGERLQGGIVMHGGFFLGPHAFYEGLRGMDHRERQKFSMTSVMFVNQLYGRQRLAILQRTDARFFNTAMMVTLGGAACSDGLEDGRVVSGVGGQYNFVAMAHELPGARSILMLRSTRTKKGRTTSNILERYGHTTIPRHLRDVVITEYGIADLRGRTDGEVVAALLKIADSRFQEGLMRSAKTSGKLPRDFRIPAAFRSNLPERLADQLAGAKRKGLLPSFPFGTDLSEEEIALGGALQGLKARLGSAGGIARAAARALESGPVPEAATACLERMGLADPQTLAEKMARRMIVSELMAAGHL
jgi:acyl-CoA hydrolase